MDEGDAVLVVYVGMGVAFGGSAVGGPAGVGHADVTGGETGASVFEGGFEDGDASDGAADVEFSGVADADAGGVVPAVFEAFKSFQEEGLGVLFSNVGDNSTHAIDLLGFQDSGH